MVKQSRVIGGHERLIWARAALDAWKFAHTLHELVGAGRGVAGFAGLLAHESNRVHVFTATEQIAEERDLLGG